MGENMFTKVVSFALLLTLLAYTGITPISAQSQNDEKRAEKAAKIKKGIQKLGTGEDAKIKVKLWDKTKVKGYVKEAGEEDFTIVEDITGNERTFNYEEIRHVSGKNLPLGVKIAIGVGIGIAAFIILNEIIFHTIIDD